MIVSDDSSVLSGGEKKKVAIARALMKKSNVILLDEPTASLDKESINSLFELLNSLKKNNIIIIVTHEAVYNHLADEVVVVKR